MRAPTPGTLRLHTTEQEEKKAMGTRENCRSHIRRESPRNTGDIRTLELPETSGLRRTSLTGTEEVIFNEK